jgi:iron complex outermembrane receptor protein
MTTPRKAATLALFAALPCLPAHAAELVADSLFELSLEQLSNIVITSVSRRPEPLADAAASVFVISAEDIRRSGVTSLPEALRLAPNLQVARTSASGYTISSRGFNGNAGNKMLVMIDGRSVYTPLFSGVFWDAQDVMLEDVERIEVISGPGGTLWGTNAVNGVINVITRPARDTQGALAAVGIGNRRNDGALRYGGKLGTDGHYRVYGKYFDIDHTSTATGSPRDDAWHRGQVGFRADWTSARDQFMLQGNAYRGTVGQPTPGTIVTGASFTLGDITISGANLAARWNRRLEDGSSFNLQAYYDRTERTVPPTFAETLNIIDVQFQHSLRPAGRHALTWGAGYRYGMDRITNSQYVAFLPAHVNQSWISLYAQDEITLRDNLRLTLGARLERNDYTGNEFLPSARLAWKPAPDHLLWTAASRAVRSPSRLDRDVFVPGSPPFLLNGGSDVRSEVATVYEVGYRGQPLPQLSYSVTAFRADYDHLRSQEIHSSGTFLLFGNGMEGRSSGIEMWATYQASRNWRLSGGLTLLDMDLRLKPGSTDPVGPRALGNDPTHQWLLRSSWDITSSHDLHVMVRRVGELPSPAVRAYTATDARLGWRVNRNLELSLTLQNIFDRAHSEYAQLTTQGEFGRSVFLKLLWRQ